MNDRPICPVCHRTCKVIEGRTGTFYHHIAQQYKSRDNRRPGSAENLPTDIFQACYVPYERKVMGAECLHDLYSR